jgi:hypothetical protein
MIVSEYLCQWRDGFALLMNCEVSEQFTQFVAQIEVYSGLYAWNCIKRLTAQHSDYGSICLHNCATILGVYSGLYAWNCIRDWLRSSRISEVFDFIIVLPFWELDYGLGWMIEESVFDLLARPRDVSVLHSAQTGSGRGTYPLGTGARATETWRSLVTPV